MNLERRQVAADTRPSHTTLDVSPPVQAVQPPSPFIIITQPESWYSFYRPTEGRRLSLPSWLVTYRHGLPVHRRSPMLVLTGSDVAQLRWWRLTLLPLSQTAKVKFGSAVWEILRAKKRKNVFKIMTDISRALLATLEGAPLITLVRTTESSETN